MTFEKEYEAVLQSLESAIAQVYQASDEAGQPIALDIPPRTASEIVACLKRIDSSIKFWNKKSGRQGYLDFINGFFPKF